MIAKWTSWLWIWVLCGMLCRVAHGAPKPEESLLPVEVVASMLGNPQLSSALGYMARMLGLGTIFIGLATVDFVIDLAADRPPAGLGTARGAPAPRAAE